MRLTKQKRIEGERLITKAKELNSFTEVPKDFWLLGVQSKEDRYNSFDDRFYLFKKEILMLLTTGTTNAGAFGLKKFIYNPKGCAVVKTNEWYYNLWGRGLHNGKMKALKQISPIKYYRDGNKNNNIDEMGKLYTGKININFHTVSYKKDMSIIKKFINGWSYGCQVINSLEDYYKILEFLKEQKNISYCLLKSK